MAWSVLAGSTDGGGKRRLLTDWLCPLSLSLSWLRSTLRLTRLDCPHRPTTDYTTGHHTLPVRLRLRLQRVGGRQQVCNCLQWDRAHYYSARPEFHILCSTAEQSFRTENFVQNKISFSRRNSGTFYSTGIICFSQYCWSQVRYIVLLYNYSYLISHIMWSQTYLRFGGLLRGSAASPANQEAAGQPTNRKPRRLGWALLAWVIIQAVESAGPAVCPAQL